MPKPKIDLSKLGYRENRQGQKDSSKEDSPPEAFQYDKKFLTTGEYTGELTLPKIITKSTDYSYIFKTETFNKPNLSNSDTEDKTPKKNENQKEYSNIPLLNKKERVLAEHNAKIKNINKVSKNFKTFISPTLFEKKVKEIEVARNEVHFENNMMRKLTAEQKHNKKLVKLEKELERKKMRNLIYIKNISNEQVEVLKKKLRYITYERLGNSVVYFCKDLKEALAENEGSIKTIKRAKRAFINLHKDTRFSNVTTRELWEHEIEGIKGCFVKIVIMNDMDKFKNKFKFY